MMVPDQISASTPEVLPKLPFFVFYILLKYPPFSYTIPCASEKVSGKIQALFSVIKKMWLWSVES